MTPIRDYVLALAEAYQVPVDLPAMQIFPVIGLCLSQKFELRLAPDWIEVPAIWTLALLPSGSRKSPLLARLTKPVTEWGKDERDRLAPDIARQQQETQVRDARMKKLRGQLANKPGNAEAKLELQELSEGAAAEEVIYAPQLIVSEPTPEALAAHLERNGERALLASAEADALDIALGRYSDGKANLGVYLSGYSGEALRISRKSGDVFLDRPVLNMALAVQPDAIRELLTHRQAKGRGLLARFFYTMPEDLVGSRNLDPAPVPEHLESGFRKAVRGLLDTDEPIAGPVAVELSLEAHKLLREFRRVHEHRMREGGGLGSRREWAAKEVGGLARIALVLEALGNSVNSANSAVGEVSAESMKAALSLAPYLESHHLLAEAILGVNPELELAEKILNWISNEKKNSITRRDCYRFLGCVPDLVDVPLKLLEDHHLVARDAPGQREGPGRKPSLKFLVSPRLGELSAPTAESAQLTESPPRAGSVAYVGGTEGVQEW